MKECLPCSNVIRTINNNIIVLNNLKSIICGKQYWISFDINTRIQPENRELIKKHHKILTFSTTPWLTPLLTFQHSVPCEALVDADYQLKRRHDPQFPDVEHLQPSNMMKPDSPSLPLRRSKLRVPLISPDL
jgi:hypothetical protein